jgi:hypothetical protein
MEKMDKLAQIEDYRINRGGDEGRRRGNTTRETLSLANKVMADSRMGVATEYRHQKRQRFIVKQGLFLHLTPAFVCIVLQPDVP